MTVGDPNPISACIAWGDGHQGKVGVGLASQYAPVEPPLIRYGRRTGRT
jgi:hypothetical protein